MPPAIEWSLVVLQSVRGRLSNLTRRVGRLEACATLGPDHPHSSSEADAFFDTVLDALDVFNNEHRVVFKRLKQLEEKILDAPTPPARQGNGPLFDALESINGELTSFAARLARLEDAAFQDQPLPRSARLTRSSPAAATVRAALGRRIRKAVSRA
ncbi:hypothetical protein [Streptomyces sp. NPDC015350]|uniref:hypothetical protein n=1 Tax=Streptomyces sp. NPDC015350 TaxID=3364955 RepID=UPI0036FF8412